MTLTTVAADAQDLAAAYAATDAEVLAAVANSVTVYPVPGEAFSVDVPVTLENRTEHAVEVYSSGKYLGAVQRRDGMFRPVRDGGGFIAPSTLREGAAVRWLARDYAREMFGLDRSPALAAE